MNEKKCHTGEFQLKGIIGNMRCKLLQKRSTGKTTECSKHLHHIAIEKDNFSELNRCIFQISLKYIKLVISKILFILVLCSFNFYFKIMWLPHPTKFPPSHQNKNKNIWCPPAKTFLRFLAPPPPPKQAGRRRVHALKALSALWSMSLTVQRADFF